MEETAKKIIDELDTIGRDYDYAYGLPIYSSEKMKEMIDVILPYLKEQN